MASSRERGNRRYQRVRVQAEPGRARTAMLLLVTVVAGAVIALGFVRFHSEQSRMLRRMQELRREFAIGSKEVENLRIEVETYKSGKHIRRAVREYGLGLREPMPGQVIRVYMGQSQIPEADWIQDGLARSD